LRLRGVSPTGIGVTLEADPMTASAANPTLLAQSAKID
jgi:hypothetical protein